MTTGIIRVGIVGANPDRGWAAAAHAPALRALQDYKITAVATTREDSARQAAEHFAAQHAFTDVAHLVEHPDVDLVSVTVKVPAHADIVRMALRAGKHVYCEWPLAPTTEDAEALAGQAREAGVHHAIGLQARHAPTINHARDLIADGYVGRVTSVTGYVAVSPAATGEIPAWMAYTLDAANGAGVVEVSGGHTLDVIEYLLGEMGDISALLSLQRPRHVIIETGESIEANTPDHLVVNAALEHGAVVSVHIHAGKVTNPRGRIEIAGTHGDLAIEALGGGVQLSRLQLLGAQSAGAPWRELAIPDRYHSFDHDLPHTAVNVAYAYRQLADDIHTGSHTIADFTTGVRVHKLLDAIRRSADTGTRQPRSR